MPQAAVAPAQGDPGPTPPAVPPGHRAVALCVLVPAVAVLVYVVAHPPGLSGDSVAVVRGAHVLIDCIRAGDVGSCDRFGGVPAGAVGPFPPPQYAIAIGGFAVGLDDAAVLKTFAIVSALAYVGLFLGVMSLARCHRSTVAASAAGLVALASPLVFYAHVTFVEMLGTTLTLLVVIAALRRSHPLLLAITALAATSTKETAGPFVIVLGAAALLSAADVRRLAWVEVRRARTHGVALALGCAAGIATHGVFNLVRYGSATNANYGSPDWIVPGTALKVRFMGALLVAPNGGVLVWWTALLLPILVALIGLVAWSRGDERSLARLTSSVVPLGVLAIQVVGLASWVSPFGWVAWGPRLLLPIVPALAVVALIGHEDITARILSQALRPLLGAVAVAGAVLLFAAPHVGAMLDPTPIERMFGPDDTCPNVPSVIADRAYYYKCLEHYAWGRKWVLRDAVDGVASPWGAGLLSAFLVGSAAMVASARREPVGET